MEILNEAWVGSTIIRNEFACSNGNGDGNGDGRGDDLNGGYSNSTGTGKGIGYSRFFTNDNGNGRSSGAGDGNGNGDLYSYKNSTDIKEFEGHKIYNIDGILTGILSIKGNFARGFILKRNVLKKECYIAKENGVFAHGSTLRDAFNSLHVKLYDNTTDEERIKAFKTKFPKYDVKYNNEDLFVYHHILTGSCHMGREHFCTNHNINMNGKTSIREFVELTKGNYGGEIIKKLPNAYGVSNESMQDLMVDERLNLIKLPSDEVLYYMRKIHYINNLWRSMLKLKGLNL